MKQLILGGIRSGKSAIAETQAAQSGLPVTYIATAQAFDQAMEQRIREHRQRRPAHWNTIEEPLHLTEVLAGTADTGRCVLVDCLSLWLSNLLLQQNDKLLQNEKKQLLQHIKTLPGQIILVSSETGLGVIPDNELARRFCDEAGLLHQQLACHCDQVVLSVAGLPHYLKGVSQ